MKYNQWCLNHVDEWIGISFIPKFDLHINDPNIKSDKISLPYSIATSK